MKINPASNIDFLRIMFDFTPRYTNLRPERVNSHQSVRADINLAAKNRFSHRPSIHHIIQLPLLN